LQTNTDQKKPLRYIRKSYITGVAMNFLKGMFSDEADVDTHPATIKVSPESQPLMVQDTTAGSAKTLTTNTDDDIQSNVATEASGLISLEEQQQQQQQQQKKNQPSTPGLTDGYKSWSQTFEAFHQAIFHTILYLLVGIAAYSYLLDTKWPIVDSLYFSIVLFTTVGYGDLHPGSKSGCIFTMMFAVYGIIILGIFLGVVGDMVVEWQHKHSKRTMETVRRKYLESFQHGSFNHQRHHPPLSPCGSGRERHAEKKTTTSWYQEICEIYGDIAKKQFWNIALMIVVAIPIIFLEKWDIVKGLYWMVITATTIGLGDETPIHPLSKALCIIYIPVAVYATGRFLGLIASSFLDKRDNKMEEEFLSRALTLGDLKRMDFDHDGRVSEAEFLIYMLLTLQKVEEEDIEDILHVFQKLDKTGDGYLSTEDLLQGLQRTSHLQTINE
jgi:hypothetical protein